MKIFQQTLNIAQIVFKKPVLDSSTGFFLLWQVIGCKNQQLQGLIQSIKSISHHNFFYHDLPINFKF